MQAANQRRPNSGIIFVPGSGFALKTWEHCADKEFSANQRDRQSGQSLPTVRWAIPAE
jgi:hypothetical protein